MALVLCFDRLSDFVERSIVLQSSKVSQAIDEWTKVDDAWNSPKYHKKSSGLYAFREAVDACKTSDELRTLAKSLLDEYKDVLLSAMQLIDRVPLRDGPDVDKLTEEDQARIAFVLLHIADMI